MDFTPSGNFSGKNDDCTAVVLRILPMWLEASRYFLFSRLLAILLAHIWALCSAGVEVIYAIDYWKHTIRLQTDSPSFKANKFHHHPADGLRCGLCAGECNWPKGRRPALLHHRHGMTHGCSESEGCSNARWTAQQRQKKQSCVHTWFAYEAGSHAHTQRRIIHTHISAA